MGVVKMWRTTDGFIMNPDGVDVHVYQSNIQMEGFRKLVPGHKVLFHEVPTAKGLSATEVEVLEGTNMVVVGDIDKTIDNLIDNFSKEECEDIAEALVR